MKTNFVTTSLTSFSEVKEFGFNNSPQLFRILSDNLYSNKLGSIIREIGSNCLDAHKLNNNESKPFEIIVPDYNVFDKSKSNLIFRDFGPGLSKEDIYSIYTTYCLSTKDNSDDFIGAFGIGSKSPFAYTDAFSVISIFDGVKTSYSIFINEKGFPAIAEIFSEETSEFSGLIVSIPIKCSDINEIKSSINQQLGRLNVLPIVKNTENVDISQEIFSDINKDIDIIIKNDHYMIGKKKTHRGRMCNSKVIISGISYEMSSQLIKKLDITDNLVINNTYIEIYLNIGEIDLIASREDIAMTEKTLGCLRIRFEELFASLLELFVSLNNKWKYSVRAQEIFDSINSTQLLNSIQFLIEYVGMKDIKKVDFLNNLVYNFDKFKDIDKIQIITSTPYKTDYARYYTPETLSKRKKVYFGSFMPKREFFIYSFSKIQRKHISGGLAALYIYPINKLKTDEEIQEFNNIVKAFSEFLDYTIENGDIKFAAELVKEEKPKAKRIRNSYRYFDIPDIHGYNSLFKCLNIEERDEYFEIEDDLLSGKSYLALYSPKDKKICIFNDDYSNYDSELKNDVFISINSRFNKSDEYRNKRIVCVTITEFERMKKTIDNLEKYTINGYFSKLLDFFKNESIDNFDEFVLKETNSNSLSSILDMYKKEELEKFTAENKNVNLILELRKLKDFAIKNGNMINELLKIIKIEPDYSKKPLIKKINEEYPLLEILSCGVRYNYGSEIKSLITKYLICGGYNG